MPVRHILIHTETYPIRHFLFDGDNIDNQAKLVRRCFLYRLRIPEDSVLTIDPEEQRIVLVRFEGAKLLFRVFSYIFQKLIDAVYHPLYC